MYQTATPSQQDDPATLSTQGEGLDRIATALATEFASEDAARKRAASAADTKPEELSLQEAPGSFGSLFEAEVSAAGKVVVRTDQLLSIALSIHRGRAADEIRLLGDESLAVYERRTKQGSMPSQTGLRLELAAGCGVNLTKQAAYELSCVLIAYAANENKRANWLVRKESIER